LAQRKSSVTDVRVAGLLGGITLADHLKAEQICDDLIELGYIARTLRGNTVQVSPPFIITDQELRLFIAAIGQAITERKNR
jgi:adenosylmethionine-8-amino-7-oxononanoate aminotransferase